MMRVRVSWLNSSNCWLLLTTLSHSVLCCNIISNTSNNIISPTVTHPQSKITVPTSDSSTHEYMSNFNLKASASNTFDKVKSALKATRFLPLRCILSTNISLNLLCPRHILYFLLSLVTVWLQNIWWLLVCTNEISCYSLPYFNFEDNSKSFRFFFKRIAKHNCFLFSFFGFLVSFMSGCKPLQMVGYESLNWWYLFFSVFQTKHKEIVWDKV